MFPVRRIYKSLSILAVAAASDTVDAESCERGAVGQCGSLLQSTVSSSSLEASAMWAPQDDGKVHIKALIETHCPASMTFLAQQYVPLMKDPEVRKLVDIELVPFANARTDAKSKKVTCQGGEAECETNRMFLCARDKLDLGNFTAFLECASPGFEGKPAQHLAEHCLKATDAKLVSRCTNSQEAFSLEKKAMRSLPKDRQYTPWLMITDERTNSLVHANQLEASIHDIMCKHAAKKPASCPSASAAAAFVAMPSIRPSARFRRSSFMQGFRTETDNDVVPGQVKLRVYFEAMCPASQSFVKNQVVPLAMAEDFRQLVDIDMTPYSNAVVDANGELSCQHGEQECKTNQRIVCARKMMNITGFMQFMDCMEPIPNTVEANTKSSNCLAAQQMTEAVEGCAQGNDAQGLRFAAYNNAPDERRYCPWLTLNNEHSEVGEHQLLETVCSLLPYDKRPARCSPGAAV